MVLGLMDTRDEPLTDRFPALSDAVPLPVAVCLVPAAQHAAAPKHVFLGEVWCRLVSAPLPLTDFELVTVPVDAQPLEWLVRPPGSGRDEARTLRDSLRVWARSLRALWGGAPPSQTLLEGATVARAVDVGVRGGAPFELRFWTPRGEALGEVAHASGRLWVSVRSGEVRLFGALGWEQLRGSWTVRVSRHPFSVPAEGPEPFPPALAVDL